MEPNLPEPSELSNAVALRVIRQASHIEFPHELDLYCPDCRRCPRRPVTGSCGHTRCTMCIEKYGHCPCQAPAPMNNHVDVVVQELVTMMFPDINVACVKSSGTESESTSSGCKTLTRRRRLGINTLGQPQRFTLQKRYELVRELIGAGCYKETLPHLAILATSRGAMLRSLHVRLLAQVITVMSGKTDPRVLTPELIRAVRREDWASADAAQLLECIICCNRLKRPITTPCGHTFCKFCIKRMIVNTGRCALCCSGLSENFADIASENQFINAVLASQPVSDHSSVEDDFIPVFNCTVAFPSVACHLKIIQQRACRVVQQVMDRGSRIFGMVGYDPDITEEYGTFLEVKDCVQLEDGCLILATVGVSRFKVLEKFGIDGFQNNYIGLFHPHGQFMGDELPKTFLCLLFIEGCVPNPLVSSSQWRMRSEPKVMMARVEKHIDSVLREMNAREVANLNFIKSSMYNKMASLLCLRRRVQDEIEAWLGPIDRGLDYFDSEVQWWEKPDGPSWLWWLIAVLPFQHSVQVELLSSKLEKRLVVVIGALHTMADISEMNYFDLVSERFLIVR